MTTSKLVFTVIMALTLISATSSNKQETLPTEVLTIEILITGRIQQIVISSDSGTEIIPLEIITEKTLKTNAMLVRNKMSELITDGWEVTSDIGGSEYQRYILIRN